MKSSDEVKVLTHLKRRKYNLLIKYAMKMFEEGAFPSVSELAIAAQVSRATAYRYFPTQSDLISAVVDECLKPMIVWQPENTRVEDRVEELLDFAFPQMLKHEGALRAALLLSLQQWAEERSSASHEEKIDTNAKNKLVRGHRKQTLSMVTEPLNKELAPELVEKVNHALSVVYGSEVFMVLKDIWQLDNDGVQSVTSWMAKAILNQARADAQAEESK